MKAIGGYFELELRQGEHYHPSALRLNSARHCFEYILRARGWRKVYLPYYTCDVILEPLKRLGVAWEFYSINEHLEPYAIRFKATTRTRAGNSIKMDESRTGAFSKQKYSK